MGSTGKLPVTCARGKGLGEADGQPALMDLRAFKYLEVNKTQAGAVGGSSLPVSILLVSSSWALLFLSC